jgi:hypothetical protein
METLGDWIARHSVEFADHRAFSGDPMSKRFQA